MNRTRTAPNFAVQHSIARMNQSEVILNELRKLFPTAHALREVAPGHAEILDASGKVIGHLDR